jgi:hypothetical protein
MFIISLDYVRYANPVIPSPSVVDKARKEREKQIQMEIALKNLFLYLMYVILLMAVVYSNTNSQGFRVTSFIQHNLGHQTRLTKVRSLC